VNVKLFFKHLLYPIAHYIRTILLSPLYMLVILGFVSCLWSITW